MSALPHLRSILEEHHDGPTTGIFTDGGANPNPGPGGWGYVWVTDDQIIKQAHGHAGNTTNNRMEFSAMIEALKILPNDSDVTVYSDSNLCVQTLNTWAKNWESRGWRRKGGEVMNLDLVKEAYFLKLQHPKVKVVWVKAHNGWRWNEYADGLASSWEILGK